MIQYKYKCFWIEIIDSVDEDTVRPWTYCIFYNGTCCHSGKHITEESCLEKAKQWVDDCGYEWLGVE